MRAAYRCRDLGLDAETFVLQRVTAAFARHAQLYPTILVSDKIDDIAEVAAGNVEVNNLASLNAQATQFVLRSTNFTAREILIDPMINLTALFRFCMAYRHGLPLVAAHYRDEARLEFKFTPLARQVFPTEVALL